MPNAISVARIAMVPVWGGCAELCLAAVLSADLAAAATWRSAAFVILITIGLSDLVDGILARRFQLASRTGATLDAVADKLAQVGLLLFFTFRGAPAFQATPIWFLVLILGRDVLLLTGWLVLRRHRGHVHIRHRMHGKVASVLLFLLLVLLTADVGARWVTALLWVIAATVVLSTADYARDGFRQLHAAPPPPEAPRTGPSADGSGPGSPRGGQSGAAVSKPSGSRSSG